jgi:hypothetical protein
MWILREGVFIKDLNEDKQQKLEMGEWLKELSM